MLTDAEIEAMAAKHQEEQQDRELIEYEARKLTVRKKAEERAQDAEQSLRKVTFTRASDIAMARPRFLWKARIPLGELTMFTGPADLGKSTVTAWLVARVTRGELEGEYFGTPKDVLMVCTEDSWRYTIRPRLEAAGADADRVYLMAVEALDGAALQFEARDAERLIRDVREAELNVALVVFDPLVSVLGKKDRNKGEDIRPTLERIKAAMEELGATGFGLGHYNKDRGNFNAVQRISGSAEFGNVIRAALGMAADEDDEVGKHLVLGVTKLNLAPKTAPSLRFVIEQDILVSNDGPIEISHVEMRGESQISVQHLMEEAASSDPAAADRRRWLFRYLTEHGEVPAQQVADAGKERDISRSALYRAARHLNVTYRDYGGASYWTLTRQESKEGGTGGTTSEWS